MQNNLKKSVKNKVAKYAEVFGISDYHYKVTLVTKKSKHFDKDCFTENVYASVSVDEDTREAFIDINSKLLSKKAGELDRTIVHELLHVRLNELLNFVDMIVDKYVRNSQAKETYKRQIELLEHKIIVALAEAIIKRHG